MTKKAEFILSLDFELGWGSIENGLWKPRETKGVYEKLRSVLPVFLRELDALEIPVTWAFVGAMLDDPEQRTFDHLPQDIKNKTLSFVKQAKSNTTDARDLFDMILDSRTKHALGSHTYSHVRFDYPGLDEEFIRNEMEQFERISKNYGVTTDSLVFPQNIEGFHEQLRQLSYQSVRTPPNKLPSKNKMLHLISSAITPPPLSIIHKMDNGLSKHSGSMFFNSGAKRMHRLPFILKQALSGLNHAIKRDGIIHIWIHPFNLAESPLLLSSLLSVLKQVSKKRDEGLIQVSTF